MHKYIYKYDLGNVLKCGNSQQMIIAMSHSETGQSF